MKQTHPGERILQFRKQFGLSQEAFAEAIDISRSNISKIESGKLELSNSILNAMMIRFAANPEWIKTGEGKMLIESEEYITKGITIYGAKQFNEGLIKVIKDPRYGEFGSLVAAEEMTKYSVDEDVKPYVEHILSLARQGDERVRTWLLVQLERAFPEVKEK